MANLKAGYRFSPKLQLTLDVLNLFNKKANDIEYWGGACTRNETLGGTGAEVVRVVTVLDRREGATEAFAAAGLDFKPVLNLADFGG